MKVEILKRQKIEGEVGTIVEVAPDRALFLLQNGGAEPVKEDGEQPKAPAKKKKGK
jgi:hypothetical protein